MWNVDDERAEGLLTTEEVAQLLGCHRTTITRMVKRGLLSPIRMTGARTTWLYKREEVESVRS